MGHDGCQEVPTLREKGSLTVETALVVPVILAVVLAVFEVVTLATTRLELVAAAREGARVAATAPDPAMAVEAARGALSGDLAGIATISVRRPSVVGQPAIVEIGVSKHLATPLLDAISVRLSARAVMRVER